MCPSMADTDFYAKKPPKIITTTTSSSDQVMTADNHAATKYFHQFLIKALIVTIFLVTLPLLPSQAPEFINQNLHAGSWELLQLIFVGIAVSYGLFSKRNDDGDIFRQSSDKEQNNNHYSKLDTAHSYVSRLLQVSSVFDDDEAEIHSSSASDDNKVETWNSRYYREEPAVVVVPKEKSVLKKQNSAGVAARVDEKPLLLPVRSLKSRVIETNDESETVRPESALKPNSVSRSNTNLGSKRYSGSNSRNLRNGESGGGGASQAKMEENIEENVVHRSPIPWRSRSGRFEMKKEDIADAETELLGSYLQTPKMEDSESRRMEFCSFRSQSFRSSKPNSAAFPCPCPSPNKPSPPTTTPSSPKVLQSPLTYFSSESQAKSVEDVAAVRKKVYYKSSPPPPPPPPPPPFLHNKGQLTKSKSSLSNLRNYPQKEMRRSIRSVPNEFRETEIESPAGEIPSLLLSKSVRTIRQSEPPVTKKSAVASVTTKEFFDENNNIIENRGFTDKMMMNNNTPIFKRQNFTELFSAADEEEKREVIEKILLETDNDDDEDSITGSEEDDYFEEVLGSSGTEEPAGADVDKKADEFIAKFREQIRLQRIESIRRSAGQLSRNRPR